MATVTIREATEDDAELLHDFMERHLSERLPVLWQRDEPPTVEQEREFVRGVRDVPGSVVLIATTGPRAVGILDFHRERRPQAAHCGRLGMSVAKEYRGQGVGRRLLNELMVRAHDNGIERVELEVLENNVPAIRLYEHIGFREEGRRRGAVRVAGTKIDILIMSRELATQG
jgi:RimJ/RimL family protein N-acetyltransferase